MSDLSQSSFRNRLFTTMSPDDFSLLQPHLESIELPVKHVLVEIDAPIAHVCFLETGLASVVAESSDEESIEIGHVGYEGMTGYAVVLGVVDNDHNKTFMQAEGSGHLVATTALREAMAASPSLQALMMRYLYSCQVQVAHTALANGRYNMNERLARWLLMCHDRLEGDEIPMTHEFLSLMLGVRRSGVTNEIHILEGIGVIKATRGNLRVVDRVKLEEVAGGCYGLAEREYDRLIAPLPRRNASGLSIVRNRT